MRLYRSHRLYPADSQWEGSQGEKSRFVLTTYPDTAQSVSTLQVRK
jgi:hypothetical protein